MPKKELQNGILFQGENMFVIRGGKKIAKRGNPGTLQTRDDVQFVSHIWLGRRPRIWLNWWWLNATRPARRSRHDRDYTRSV
jgi:hypothetical protein